MTTTTQKLAEALRACLPHMTVYADDADIRDASLSADKAARDALAAYDAQQAETPIDGAWISEPITNVVSAPPIRGRAYREPVASCNSAEYAARIVQCVNAHDGLVSALQAYQLTVSNLQRTTNPEEWETHGDWGRLDRMAADALAQAGVTP